MKRRGFLGLMGGAVAAGPKLAGELASQGSLGFASLGVPLGAIAATSDGEWRLSRIKELRSLLTSGETEDQRRHKRINRAYQMEALERFRLDSLRSVSAQRKMAMLMDSNESRHERINRMSWEDELERLLKPDFL